MTDYYDRMRVIRDRLNTALLPYSIRVSYVGTLKGSITTIWWFGKTDTGFATGPSPEAVVDRILQHVFGGL